MKNNLLSILCSQKLKYSFIIIFLLFLFVAISAISYVNAVSTNISNNVFRLHVIANSDSTEDQNLKYIVRDSILEHVNSIGNSANSKKELISMLDLNDIKNIAKKTILEQGYDYDVSVEIGNFSFPTKTYGDISLPSGFYDALRIKIGNGEGKNWWCVMFPPLCFVDISSGIVPESSKKQLKNSMNEEEYHLISASDDSVKFKFKLVEFLQNFGTQFSMR